MYANGGKFAKIIIFSNFGRKMENDREKLYSIPKKNANTCFHVKESREKEMRNIRHEVSNS